MKDLTNFDRECRDKDITRLARMPIQQLRHPGGIARVMERYGLTEGEVLQLLEDRKPINLANEAMHDACDGC